VKVEVCKINEEPFSLSQDIPASQWDLDSEDIKFSGDIHLECEFQLCYKEILITGKAILHRVIICSRCLQEVSQKQTKKITLSYNTTELGEFLDIDPDVRQEILLTFPLKVLCKDDCKGICADCGVDLNTDRCKCCKKD
jgi:uncharacterized protein